MFETTSTETSASAYELERNKPMPTLNHARIQSRLITRLSIRYEDRFDIASELSLDLSDWPSVPDISILPKEDLDLRNDVIAVTKAPLGVIEIISPSQSLSFMISKAEAYFAHGVKSCWIVLLPLGNIYVFSDANHYKIYRETETLRDDVLDIELPLNDVFC